MSYTRFNLIGEAATNVNWEHIDEFAGRPRVVYDVDIGLTDPAGQATAILNDYSGSQQSFATMWDALTHDPRSSELEALIMGCWCEYDAWREGFEGSTSELVDMLVAHANEFAQLQALFLPEVISEEHEISWIKQSDVSPLFDAFPRLTVLQLRGGDGLEFRTPVQHSALDALIVQCSNLPQLAVQQLGVCSFPNLTHLELWVGEETWRDGPPPLPEDFLPIFSGKLFPRLRYLGLRNAENADALVEALVGSPILNQIEALDLSLGDLHGRGVELLLSCLPSHPNIRWLNIEENGFIEEELERAFEALPCEVIQGHQEPPEVDFYYVSVGE